MPELRMNFVMDCLEDEDAVAWAAPGPGLVFPFDDPVMYARGLSADDINQELELAALDDELAGHSRGEEGSLCYACREPYEILGDGRATHVTGSMDHDFSLDRDHEPNSGRRGSCYDN